MAAPDEPGLLAALVGQRGDLTGVRALLAEGGIVERQPGDLRASARRHGFRPAQVRRLFMVRELARRWHVPADSAAPAVTSPREVFGPALTLGAAAVILAHNHPSGDPTPSPEDLAVTRHLQEAGRLLGVEVLDHLVVCAERFRSLRESGAL